LPLDEWSDRSASPQRTIKEMTHADPATLIGTLGVALLLISFLLNQVRLLRSDGYFYLGLNLVGAGLACYSSYLINFMPFVLLEGVWALVALAAITRALVTGAKAA
jgi:hypothetical protein